MRTSAYSALALGLGLSLAQLSACSNSSDDCSATASCGAASGNGSSAGTSGSASGGTSTEGGSEGAGTSNTGGGGTAGDGSGVPCTGDVAEDAACWTSNEYGVFVSNEHGDDATGNGTKEAPYASITKGLSSAGGKKVYVCLGPKGDYTDALSLDSAEGVEVYGGFECETWEYSKSRKAGIAPAKNIALRISKSKNLVFENLRFTAADASGTGYDASSYGAFVTDSKGVVFRRVEITAGKGAKGADGEAGTRGADGPEPGMDQDGKPGLCESPPKGVGGNWPPTPLCGGTRGGDGGDAVLDTDGANGFNGIPSTNVTPSNVKNSGAGAIADKVDGGLGQSGSPGNDGTLGTAASTSGTFNTMGYVGANGNEGTPGFPGQGGGGGGASKGTASCRGASGGAGGMGGCGGTEGQAGLGGGASVGLFSTSSDVALEACAISSAAGGAGGKGGNGGGLGLGALGGNGGAPDGTGKVAPGGGGGRGGNGGIGGSGSGGTGGPSYALVFAGTKPTYAEPETKLATGVGGAAGPGGQVDMDAPRAPDGAVGASATELEIQ